MPQQNDRLAFDRASMRRIDVDGRMHVELAHISKAVVNPYLGQEIPGFEQLGLEANKIYFLLRDPEELRKAAPTFNNLPLLKTHRPVSAAEPGKDLIVGSTGTDCTFNAPYLDNSLVIWDAAAIAGIESGQQKEISCGYRYVPVMQPGTHEGVPYDGRMTNIIGNHVALVETGRAGPDVVVSDSNPFLEFYNMSKTSRKAIAVKAGLGAYLMPLLAADAKLDLGAIVGLPKTKTFDADAQRIARAVIAATNGKLAGDAKLDEAVLIKAIKMAADEQSDYEMEAKDEVPEETEEERKKREEEEARKAEEMKGANDAAINARIAAAAEAARKQAMADMQALRTAEEEVHPIIGKVAGMDSAQSVYKMALDSLKVDVTGVHPSAYRAIVMAHAKAATAEPVKKTSMAQDSASVDGFQKAFGLKK